MIPYRAGRPLEIYESSLTPPLPLPPPPFPLPPPPSWIRWPWVGERGLRLRRFNVLHSAPKCYRSALLNVAEKLRSLPNIYRTVLRCRRPVSVPAIHSSVTRIRLAGGSDFPCVLPKLHVSKLDSVDGRHPESGRTAFMGAGAEELGDWVGFGKHRIYSCGGNISQGFRVSHMRLVSAVILSRAGLILLGEMGEERRGGERKEWGGREGGGMEEGEVGGRKGRDWGKRGREGREGGRGGREGGGMEEGEVGGRKGRDWGKRGREGREEGEEGEEGKVEGGRTLAVLLPPFVFVCPVEI